jgi:hypothetical protein
MVRSPRAILALAASVAGTAASGASGSLITFNVYNGSGVSANTINAAMDFAEGASGVEFQFVNNSAAGTRITDIYIEAAPSSLALLSNPVILPQMGGVNFAPGAAPPVPGANISDFGGSWRGNLFTLSANGANALDPGETLTVSFTLGGGFGSLAEALQAEYPTFRIVELVQANSGGAWVVNYPVPEPASALLLAMGSGLCLRRRR